MVCGEKIFVDSVYDDVADITHGKGDVCIKVKVLRLWKVLAFLNPGEFSSIKMVLMDGKGAKIHATIRKQLFCMFDSKIKEGNAYEMSYFSVFTQSGNYRTTHHSYKLVFQAKTSVVPADNSGFTQSGINITSLAEICAFNHDYKCLVDVIGVMTGISVEREYVRDGKLTKMVVIELIDHSCKCECALFGDYTDAVTKKIGKTSGGLPTVVIQFAKVKIFREKTSIQNVMSTTRVLINPDIPEVEVFKNSIAVHGIEVDVYVPMIGGHGRPPLEEKFLRMHPKKSLADLNNLCEGGVFVVCAEIVRDDN